MNEIEHNLKIVQPHFDLVSRRIKNLEVRLNDRDYKVGDTLNLHLWETETQEYGGLWISRNVTYVLDDPKYCKEGYIILGIE